MTRMSPDFGCSSFYTFPNNLSFAQEGGICSLSTRPLQVYALHWHVLICSWLAVFVSHPLPCKVPCSLPPTPIFQRAISHNHQAQLEKFLAGWFRYPKFRHESPEASLQCSRTLRSKTTPRMQCLQRWSSWMAAANILGRLAEPRVHQPQLSACVRIFWNLKTFNFRRWVNHNHNEEEFVNGCRSCQLKKFVNGCRSCQLNILQKKRKHILFSQNKICLNATEK